MVQKLVILSGLILSAACMVLHQAPLPEYFPIRYEEQPTNYDFAYEVNDPHTGDFKRQQESRRGGIVLGQYSLLQPDGVTRIVNYRADDHNGFKAVVNNERSPKNAPSNRQGENDSEASERQANDRPQVEESRQTPNDQQATPTPLTISHTSLIHRAYLNAKNPWI
ncbi:unnamed protein product [Parnassius apollo]|uniref:(apollo) hypothetical protein n=1 Tax=Parnassius apollo TaxID=110799 RepID=A0A8S3X6T9_PARAO|nr:unnamed protein product [Parnassius apollo]